LAVLQPPGDLVHRDAETTGFGPNKIAEAVAGCRHLNQRYSFSVDDLGDGKYFQYWAVQAHLMLAARQS
jgi:hypothetical protein